MIGKRTLSAARRFAKRAAPESRLMRAAFYAAEGVRVRLSGRHLAVRDLMRTYPHWQETQTNDRWPLDDERPWISFGALEFLDGALRPEMTVFEYGAGGSTMFFARRVASGESVESDAEWAQNVRRALAGSGITNWKVHLIGPTPSTRASADPASADDYASSVPQFAGMEFSTYASMIDSRPDASLDLVLVDGYARPACVRHAMPKIKPGGYLVLDNSERKTYRGIRERLGRSGWIEHEFYGPGPYVLRFWATTVWQKPLG